uniref:Bifunctional inhibitor/plant lipid transfer protein/seed storage helical domain-containing protein n=1 Tax=Leersia perrieri TaxID=77586 RepID=A0A0D9WM52_9ORYZ
MPMTPTRHSTSPAMITVAIFAFFTVLAGLAAAETADLCGLAQTAFSDCTAYVTGDEPALSSLCCRGLGDIRDLTPTISQRRAVCACVLDEMLAAGNGKFDSGRAGGLAAACNVPIGFIPTSAEFNCYGVN